MSSTLCKIGLHKWSKKRFIQLAAQTSAMLLYCQRCGKRKHWIETV